MSREIKFRMVTQITGEIIGYTDTYRLLRNGEDELGDNFEKAVLAGVIFEQYTGLKDNNGKEIYEGDIVKYKLYADSRLSYIDEVFYNTMSGAFMVGDEDNIRTLDYLINVEVVGNIHENPELLGGKK